MADTLWIKIRSWHALPFGALNQRAYCGRTAAYEAERSDELPAGKSCETCLRAVARKADLPPVDNEDAGS